MVASISNESQSCKFRILKAPYAVAACLVCLMAAGVVFAQTRAFAPRFRDKASFDRFVEEGRESPFGVDYVFVHSPGARDRKLVDGVCEKVAIRWVNLARLDWNIIEKRPPKNGIHTYDWSDLDRAVQTWQRNGIHIMVSARFFSPWATAPKDDFEFVYLKGPTKWLALKGADYLQRPEHRKDFRDYVRNLVERYDGDGRNDMPGLLFPVLHYQVGNEYYNELFWAGTADEYGQLLREFAGAARAACPEVKIILSGIGFKNVDGFYDVKMAPRTAAYVKYYLPKIPVDMRGFVERSYQFSKATVGMHDAYDILDARWPNYGIVTNSKQLLKQAGCPDKEVWSAEIYSGFPLMEPLVLPNWTLQAWPTPSKSKEYLKTLKNPRHPEFDEINAWYRGLQAAQVVKICMAALDAGSQKLMMGWAVDAQHAFAVSTLSHHGLYTATFKHLWPAAHTYNLTIRKLDGLKQIRRLRIAADIYVYECLLQNGRQVLVAFHDDHIGQNHDQPTGEIAAVIPVQGTQAQITSIITEIGRAVPKVRKVSVASGMLRTKLTEYPVFIEATGSQE
ncbi:MAG: beta-galactosidase [Planctomycetes bacterium]|nr:beta-galactosidase [Planctomycetota bacterium]MBL7040341.1 beta-galactosidase [Pirellulaceae bacterium]